MCGCKDTMCKCKSEEQYDGFMANNGGLSNIDDRNDNFLGFGKKDKAQNDTSLVADRHNQAQIGNSETKSKPKSSFGDTLSKVAKGVGAMPDFLAGLKGQTPTNTDQRYPGPSEESNNTMVYISVIAVIVIFIVIGVIISKSNK